MPENRGLGTVSAIQMKVGKPIPGLRDKFTLAEAQQIANAIITQINLMAVQLFELHNNMHKILSFKPRRVYKCLSREYQNQLERSYGEHILRHVVLTSQFCFPSEDFTGQLNDVVAKKTREVIRMHAELEGEEFKPVDEVNNVVVDEEGKKNRRQRDMSKYAPLIFEECFVRAKGPTKVANTFEIDARPDLKKLVDPSVTNLNYKGMHLIVLSHGFQGSSFDLRVFKNCISIAMPDALFLCATSNEHDSDQSIYEMGQRLA